MKNLKNIFAIITLLITFNSYSQHLFYVCEISQNTALNASNENDSNITIIPVNCNQILIDRSNIQLIRKKVQNDFVIEPSNECVVNVLYGVKFSGNNNFYYFKFSSIASVDENKMNVSELIAYPNPAVNQINVKFETNKTNMPISVYSLTGALVYRNEDTRDFGRNELTIEVSGLAEGMYLIRVGDEKLTNEDGDVTNVFKFVKTRN